MREEDIEKEMRLAFLILVLALVLLVNKCCRQQEQIRVYQTQLISLPIDERTEAGHKVRRGR